MAAYQQPGKVWHAWQNTKLFAKALFNAKERPKVVTMGKRTGLAAIGVGGIYAGIMVVSFPFNLVPLLGGIVMLAVNASRMSGGLDAIKGSNYGRQYLSARRQAWENNRKKGPLLQRLKMGVKKAFYGTTKFAAMAVAGAGAGLAVAAGLAAGGVGIGAVAPVLAALTVVSLPVTIGVGIAVAAVGAVTSIASHRQLKVINGTATQRGGASAKANKSTLPAWLQKAQDLPDTPKAGAFNKASTPSSSSTSSSTRRFSQRQNRL